MSPPKVWFITGASTGFGFYLACHALDKGDKVVATMRNPCTSGKQLELKYRKNENLLILQLDVTNTLAIASAFKTAKDKYGRIDVVFNNAGTAMLCEFEGTPEYKARAIFNVNFWGAANVTKEAVKTFRENSPPGGHLLQNASSAALTCNPGVSFYGASKAALESITEAVSQELDPRWGIKITILEAGPYNTAAIASNMIQLPPSPDSLYSNPNIGANPIRAYMASGELYKAAGDPKKAVKVFYKVAGMENPPFRLLLHPSAVQGAQTRIDSLQKGLDEFQQWSEVETL